MNEQEKEQILYQMDEKVENLDSKIDNVQEDVRTNRQVFNNRFEHEAAKSDKALSTARANKLRIAGLGFGVTLLLSIAANNAGLLNLI